MFSPPLFVTLSVVIDRRSKEKKNIEKLVEDSVFQRGTPPILNMKHVFLSQVMIFVTSNISELYLIYCIYTFNVFCGNGFGFLKFEK